MRIANMETTEELLMQLRQKKLTLTIWKIILACHECVHYLIKPLPRKVP